MTWILLLLTTLAAHSAPRDGPSPTSPCQHRRHLVLLRHETRGLQLLDERWSSVTNPTSPEYRRFESRAEILRQLAPFSPAERELVDLHQHVVGFVGSVHKKVDLPASLTGVAPKPGFDRS